MDENYLDELNRILINHHQTDFETRILNGIYWFGESMSVPILDEKDKRYVEREKTHENLEYFNLGEKVIKLFTSLESVLMDDNEPNKTQNISKRGSLLIGHDIMTVEQIESDLKHLYNVRGEIVHRGNAFVSKYDLSDLINYTRAILFSLIDLNRQYRFNSIKELIKYIKELDQKSQD